MEEPLILVINPGSMTTKVAFFKGEQEVVTEELKHSQQEISRCAALIDQLPLREQAVLAFIERHKGKGVIGAVACRGAPLKPLEGGTYRINETMVDDIRSGRVQSPHVSMLAALIGASIASQYGVPAFITDPISVDEYTPLARITGFPGISRRSLWHALNCRAVARQYGRNLGKSFMALNLIVAHLGSGITVVCLEKGKAVDSTNANSEAPFSPERSGTLPALELIDICFNGTLTREEMIRRITRESGLKALLGTNDALEVEKRIAAGDEKARIVYEAMAYGISKTIGSLATVLKGHVDAILLTGSLARSAMLTDWIRDRVAFIAPVHLYAGQEEMKSLALSVGEVLGGREKEKIYS
jgi:butyrate kinase